MNRRHMILFSGDWLGISGGAPSYRRLPKFEELRDAEVTLSILENWTIASRDLLEW